MAADNGFFGTIDLKAIYGTPAFTKYVRDYISAFIAHKKACVPHTMEDVYMFTIERLMNLSTLYATYISQFPTQSEKNWENIRQHYLSLFEMVDNLMKGDAECCRYAGTCVAISASTANNAFSISSTSSSSSSYDTTSEEDTSEEGSEEEYSEEDSEEGSEEYSEEDSEEGSEEYSEEDGEEGSEEESYQEESGEEFYVGAVCEDDDGGSSEESSCVESQQGSDGGGSRSSRRRRYRHRRRRSNYVAPSLPFLPPNSAPTLSLPIIVQIVEDWARQMKHQLPSFFGT